MFEKSKRPLYPNEHYLDSDLSRLYSNKFRVDFENQLMGLIETHADALNINRNSKIRQAARFETAIDNNKMLLLSYELKDSIKAYLVSPLDITMQEYLEVYIHAEISTEGSLILEENIRHENLLLSKVGKLEYFNLEESPS